MHLIGVDERPASRGNQAGRQHLTWTKEAIDRGYRPRNFEEFRILGLAQQGHITGPVGQQFGSVGGIINCPPMFRLP